MNKIRLSFLLGMLAMTNFIFGQENQLTIPWSTDKLTTYNSEEFYRPTIEKQGYNGDKVNFHWMNQVALGYNAKLTISDFSTSNAPSSDIDYLERFNIEVPNQLNYEAKVTNAVGLRYEVVNVFPYIKENNQIRRVTSITVSRTKLPVVNSFIYKDFASESVLKEGSGSWYKISLKKDGIYKLDKAFFENAGIDVSTVDPNHINIYGNGDGKLPELNSMSRTDDLALNSIQFIGGDDGSFDDGDYILFYGWGPHRWYANGLSSFSQDRNVYSDYAYYFININPNATPERITPLPLVDDPVTDVTTSYSYYDIHENDFMNPVGGGQRWYGELFDGNNLSQTFNFAVPNPVSSYLSTMKVTMGTNNRSATGGNFTYSINGTQVQQSNLSTLNDFARSTETLQYSSPNPIVSLTVVLNRNNPDIIANLDRIELNTRRFLTMNVDQMNFRDLSTVDVGNVTTFTLSGLDNDSFVWDITDRHHPKVVQGSIAGTDYSFTEHTDSLREFVASKNGVFYTPVFVKEIQHQNLHALGAADYLIVTHELFRSQANRLADLHRTYEGLTVHVVSTEEIYNEFSSGALDPTAIRSFAKMFYDRYAGDPDSLKYMCLFGDGTYDPKGRVDNNNNYVPTYQVVGSNSRENHIYNLVTDDFYAMLDDDEAISYTDKVDIGVGRLLISSLDMAREQVNKIEHYMLNGSTLFAEDNANCIDGVSTSTFGDWRMKVVNVGDDEESGYFLNTDLEPAYDFISSNYPDMNVGKVYLDAYQQVSTAGGHRYPDVVKAIDESFERGSLIVNYVGHGGEVGVAEERVITVPQIQGWRNIDNLPLMVSATCEFTKYDDPSRVSAGEWASINPTGGAIALMTTSRSVFFGVNSNTVREFYKNSFKRHADFSPRTFGEIISNTKIGINDGDNKRSFTLIGDPALKIALPRYEIVIDSINGLDPAVEMDTIQALSKVRIVGHLEDFQGNVLSGFNGVATPSIYDKPKHLQTLGQDPTSPVIDFDLQQNIIYRGKATVTDGYFAFEFVTPKDIDYSYGFGKISTYANSRETDALGEEQRVYVGGINPNGLDDNVGPDIDLYMNDENFANGGMTDETPYLIARLFDENGINTVGNGIGHDIIAVLDENSGDPIVLNSYYTADLDSYQSGEVRYQFPSLEPGLHTLSFKAWDVNNNSSTATIEFVVQEQTELELDHVLNYPNPFTTSTEFFFEHNQCCTELRTQIQIFTVSGKLVKTINKEINTPGFRSEGIAWDGKDEFGDQLAKGVYVYRVKVETPDGMKAEKIEKLVLLR